MNARAVGVVALAGLLAAGCGDALLVTPGDPGPVAFSLTFAPSAAVTGGVADAFARTDAARVQLTAGGAGILDTTVSVSGSGDRTVGLRVRLPASPLPMAIGVDLDAAGKTLFRGTGSAQLTRGRRTEAVVTLSPVVAGIVLPDSLPTIVALGDTSHAQGAAVFASGDTVQGAALTWSDGGSAVVRVQPDGSIKALSEGTATLSATYPGFAGSTHIRVRAIVVAVGFTAGTDTTSIDLGGTTQLVAVPRDRNGNSLVRTPVWTSGNPAVATVDANGSVRGVAPGTTTVSATVEGKTATIQVRVRARIIVKPADTTLMSGDSTILVVGDSATFKATAFDSQGRIIPGLTFTWSTSNPDLLNVPADSGIVEAWSEGSARVVAKLGADSGFARVHVIHPVIGLAADSAPFNVPFGGAGGPMSVGIINAGSGAISGLWVQIQYPASGPFGWLSATLSSTTPPANLLLSVNPVNLPSGTYTAKVLVFASSPRGVPPATITVTMTVAAPVGSGTHPPTIPPSGS